MRKLKGTIVSNKMTKTVVVRTGRLKKHSKYQKYYRVSRRFKAHDERAEYHTGDEVWIQETKPISKEKKWKVVALVKRAESGDTGSQEDKNVVIVPDEDSVPMDSTHI